MEQLTLTRSQVEQMVTHAQAVAPPEARGLLGGHDEHVLCIIAHLDRTQSSLRGFRVVEGRTSEARLRVLNGHQGKSTKAQLEADGGV